MTTSKSKKKNKTFVIDSAAKVTLRGRINGAGNYVSLYLDWMENKKRMYQFLEDKMYAKPKSDAEKLYNETVKKKALEEMTQKSLMLLNDRGLKSQMLSKISFSEFYNYCRDYSTSDGGKKDTSTKANYDASLRKIEEFAGNSYKKLMIKDIDAEWVWKYREFLLNCGIHKNTAVIYFGKLRAVLNLAVKLEYLDKNPFTRVDNIKYEDPTISYLLFEDIKKLKETHCESEVLKKAGLFASQTGLRACDCKVIKWKDIKFDNDKYYIDIKQQKTDVVYRIHFKKNVMDIIGPPADPEEFVFPKFKNDRISNSFLKNWLLRAKIDKEFTFHDFRHSFAIQLGLSGANLYEISKMLGHAKIHTTERHYARILDEVKRDLIDKLPEL